MNLRLFNSMIVLTAVLISSIAYGADSCQKAFKQETFVSKVLGKLIAGVFRTASVDSHPDEQASELPISVELRDIKQKFDRAGSTSMRDLDLGHYWGTCVSSTGETYSHFSMYLLVEQYQDFNHNVKTGVGLNLPGDAQEIGKPAFYLSEEIDGMIKSPNASGYTLTKKYSSSTGDSGLVFLNYVKNSLNPSGPPDLTMACYFDDYAPFEK